MLFAAKGAEGDLAVDPAEGSGDATDPGAGSDTDPAVDPGTEPTVPPTDGTDEPLDPSTPAPEETLPPIVVDPAPPAPEVVEVTVDDATATLLLMWDADGNAWLVPGYAMQTPEGWWNAVVSLVDGVIALPEQF